jgi:hypothetical protein
MARDSWGENLQCPHCRKPAKLGYLQQTFPDQHPRQIDPYHLVDPRIFTVDGRIGAEKWSFLGPLPTLFDDSAVPNELVPGAAALVPKAPPVTGMPPATDVWCDPMPPPRANAAVTERLTQRAAQRTESFFMPRLLRTRNSPRM